MNLHHIEPHYCTVCNPWWQCYHGRCIFGLTRVTMPLWWYISHLLIAPFCLFAADRRCVGGIGRVSQRRWGHWSLWAELRWVRLVISFSSTSFWMCLFVCLSHHSPAHTVAVWTSRWHCKFCGEHLSGLELLSMLPHDFMSLEAAYKMLMVLLALIFHYKRSDDISHLNSTQMYSSYTKNCRNICKIGVVIS